MPTTISGSLLASRVAAAFRSRAVSEPVTSSGDMPSGASSVGERARVLLGEQFGRRHDRGLVVVLDREQRGEQRDDRLAAPHVALQQAVHAQRAGHVLHDLARRAHLRAGELEREQRLELAS